MEQTMVVSQSSVEITKNRLGYGYTVKAYGMNSDEIITKLEVLVNNVEKKISDIGGSYGKTSERKESG